jgi:hypothetical protein
VVTALLDAVLTALLVAVAGALLALLLASGALELPVLALAVPVAVPPPHACNSGTASAVIPSEVRKARRDSMGGLLFLGFLRLHPPDATAV